MRERQRKREHGNDGRKNVFKVDSKLSVDNIPDVQRTFSRKIRRSSAPVSACIVFFVLRIDFLSLKSVVVRQIFVFFHRFSSKNLLLLVFDSVSVCSSIFLIF